MPSTSVSNLLTVLILPALKKVKYFLWILKIFYQRIGSQDLKLQGQKDHPEQAGQEVSTEEDRGEDLEEGQEDLIVEPQEEEVAPRSSKEDE
jgi:hypothetical protein